MSLAALKSVGAYALVLVGVATLIVFSALSFHPSRAGAASRSAAIADTSPLASGLSAGFSCTALSRSSASAENLREAQMHARALLDRGETSEALSRLRSLAAMDGGLPGINLDLSTALLKTHQTEAAKSAANLQLSASECLTRMTPDAVDAYCKAQMAHSSTATCRQELASIERSAHFQAAMVQMEIANSLGGAPALDTANVSAAPQPERRAVHNLLAAGDDSVATPKAAAAKPKAPRAAGEGRNPLAAGAGTDAALGAYSR